MLQPNRMGSWGGVGGLGGWGVGGVGGVEEVGGVRPDHLMKESDVRRWHTGTSQEARAKPRHQSHQWQLLIMNRGLGPSSPSQHQTGSVEESAISLSH